jgi:hypothetical protein
MVNYAVELSTILNLCKITVDYRNFVIFIVILDMY